MSFFKKLGETAKSTASSIGSKSAELVSSGKVMMEKKQLEGKVIDKYTELGSVYYQAFASQTALNSEQVTSICNEIKVLKRNIDEIDEKVHEEQVGTTQPQASAGTKCPTCGNMVEAGKKFCIECGSSMTEPVKTMEQSNTKTCPKCAATVGAGLKFCSECGEKLL